MAEPSSITCGIFTLPNEILLDVFGHYPTKELVHFSSTCKHFHSLIVRVLYNRIQATTCLDNHSLYLECGPPAAKYTTSKVLCTMLGIAGLEELNDDIQKCDNSPGLVRRIGELYTRFRPVNKEPDWLTVPRPHPSGDIPGSRTYVPVDAVAARVIDQRNAVTRTVGIDSHFLFSQLETVAFLGRRGSVRGLICSQVNVCEGTIRVWRDWLSKQCESKRWTDGEAIPIIHEDQPITGSDGRLRSGSIPDPMQPQKDPSILWLNTGKDAMGIKFRVKEQKWRRQNPVLFETEIEVPVSYQVEFEEVLVRTSHLLLMVEDAQGRVQESSTKALVFGSFTG